MNNTTQSIALTSEFSDLVVDLDPSTGAPLRLSSGGHTLTLQCRVRLITEGLEARAAAGGLDYVDTTDVFLAPNGVGSVSEQVMLGSRRFDVPVATSDPERWSALWHVEFKAEWPRLSVGLEVVSHCDAAILRNVVIDIVPALTDASGWQVQSPGSKMRANLELVDLTSETTIQTAAGVEGSTGLVAFECLDPSVTFLFWPLSKTNYGETALAPHSEGARLSWLTDVAGVPGAGGSLTAGPLQLDLIARDFPSILREVPTMLARAGITSPNNPPVWGAGANLYEVQIGFGVFRGGYQYAPYPTADDLLHDLGRIQSLGYTALQIMPRQPYPSYNVHDYDDITTNWGDEAILRQIVDECHARGMHVIFDILLHGVIDGEAMDAALAAIDSGPYVERLDEATPDVTTLERDEMHYYLVAWTRHVKDFEPYWRGGSPQRHALVDEHPEWFCRDSAGNITGVYTQAFDASHPGWQDYFIGKCLAIMERMGIDGFRFDAPSYNYFLNWSDRTRTDASVSMLGCLPLFERLRKAMRDQNPDSLLYTEPSGVLYRMAMDVAYNYDEQWLVRAVMEDGAGKSHWIRNARELGQWFAWRDATLAPGSLTAHHLDSHDTFWWPEPGFKWRREQYGEPATAALMAVFALSGGPYMTFVGGEVGIEDAVRAVNSLRLSHPWFARGGSNYDAVGIDRDDVYAVLRESTEGSGLLLVNLSDQPVTASVNLQVEGEPTVEAHHCADVLTGGPESLWRLDEGLWTTVVGLGAFEAKAFNVGPLRRTWLNPPS